MGEWETLRRELDRQGKTPALEQLAQSADGRALSRLVDGETLRRAAESGDSAALSGLLGQVLQTQEGRRMAEEIRRLMAKK